MNPPLLYASQYYCLRLVWVGGYLSGAPLGLWPSLGRVLLSLYSFELFYFYHKLPPPSRLEAFPQHFRRLVIHRYLFSNMHNSTPGRRRFTFAGGGKGGRIWCSVLAIVANVPSTLAQNQFQQFFPGWDGLISGYLRDNCTQEMNDYKGNPMGHERWDLVDCVLDQFSETRKAEAAAAALTLGLAPMLLQSIGPSTSQTSLLFMRRPVLASLLAICSPWPSNPDSTIYSTTQTAMERSLVSFIRVERQNVPSRVMASVVSLVEYAMALGAAANVALLAYQLGHWGFFASANNTYDPVLWTYNALIIHLVGFLGIFLQFHRPGSNGHSDAEVKREQPTWFPRWLYHEFTPSAYNTSTPLPLRERGLDERHCLLALSLLVRWILSIAPTLQVVFGTIMLSGSLLTAQGDARNCLFRYLASAVVARALLLFEIACLKPEGSAATNSDGAGKNNIMLGEGRSNTTKHPSTLIIQETR